MSHSSTSSSAPWRSLLSLALASPTFIILVVQNFTIFTYTMHIPVLLLFWLSAMGSGIAIFATALGYQALKYDPLPLASLAFFVGGICSIIDVVICMFILPAFLPHAHFS